ncbi:hypothetical protein, partial [uncultured Thiodictyon sp.]|uniref:hypothetical protein n=1 Tax=uncultured Thiodictyon sp. TaxID=1846217 RepID=UPI0025DC2B8B
SDCSITTTTTTTTPGPRGCRGSVGTRCVPYGSGVNTSVLIAPDGGCWSYIIPSQLGNQMDRPGQ